MSKYKLTFTLKQHTPLIHFQHDQDGATLRATELKPKLDRFLIQKLGLTQIVQKNGKEKEVPKEEFKHWFINDGKEHLALDYKVRIEKINRNNKDGTVVIIPPERSHWILSFGVNVAILTFKKQLLDILSNTQNGKLVPSDLLNEFFAIHNFGKRQSKGFGAFYPEKMTKDEFESYLKLSGKDVYRYKNPLQTAPYLDRNNHTYFYKKLSNEWQRLKSGKNHPKLPYEKSRVFEYSAGKGFRWDKRWIKRHLKHLINNKILKYDLKYDTDPIDIGDRNSWEDNNNAEYRYGRAFLGLAELYEYLTEDKNVRYQVTVDGGEIERFKSPITFKIFEKNIYAIIEDIPREMFDKPFRFGVQQKRKKNGQFVKDGNEIHINDDLYTPNNLSEFDLKEFASAYLNDINFKPLQ